MRRSVSFFVITFMSVLVFAYGQDAVVAQGAGPSRTYLPNLTVPVCTTSPLRTNASDVALTSKDLPPKYNLVSQGTTAWEVNGRFQSKVTTEFDYGDPDVGPTNVSDTVVMFCNEQIAADNWLIFKAVLHSGLNAYSEEPKLEIGDETYVIVDRYRYLVWYSLAFREKNAMVYLVANGRNGVLDLDIVENLADTIEEKLTH